ncbi:zinc finger and BTB domain-containing protein 9 [Tachyglossus aculeatus]|uniref:zinc finger and BTB domain-containing protein 9 n=1 Tax=Tachyglossus aculeatus TaxID=9261 RepID=UPI0018F6C994|nr:zinc finger and BTB domain-containing protein 9 [Tachyglossus aculeatus]
MEPPSPLPAPSPLGPGGPRTIQIEFPQYSQGLLETLNRHRLEGKFCDIALHVQGRVLRAHKSVLAASSPYFHDKLLLRDTACLALPSVIEADAFEGLLQLIYSGRLRLPLDALPGHLLVASGLQMWQVVDQCSEILRELEAANAAHAGRAGGARAAPSPAAAVADPGPGDVLRIRVEEDDEEEDDDDDEAAAVPGPPPEAAPPPPPPAAEDLLRQAGGYPAGGGAEPGFLLTPGLAAAAAAAGTPGSGTAAAAAAPQGPSWKPVDLHGNEILAQGGPGPGQAVHGPVKLGGAPPPDGKRFGCLCGKRFAVKPKRDRHIMLTFSLRPFGCGLCNKRFKLKHHLTEHMKTHAGALHACPDCGRRFRVHACFLRHRDLCKGQGWATAHWTYK